MSSFESPVAERAAADVNVADMDDGNNVDRFTFDTAESPPAAAAGEAKSEKKKSSKKSSSANEDDNEDKRGSTDNDFEPPLACVNRILKASLPDNISITKDARAAFTRAAGIYIFYLTQCANDLCRESKRQTIGPNDIVNAMRELDFEDLVPDLEEFMESYRTVSNAKKLGKKAASLSVKEDGGAGGNVEMEEDNEEDDAVMKTGVPDEKDNDNDNENGEGGYDAADASNIEDVSRGNFNSSALGGDSDVETEDEMDEDN